MSRFVNKIWTMFKNNKKVTLIMGGLSVSQAVAFMSIPLIFREIQLLSKSNSKSSTDSEQDNSESKKSFPGLPLPDSKSSNSYSLYHSLTGFQASPSNCTRN